MAILTPNKPLSPPSTTFARPDNPPTNATRTGQARISRALRRNELNPARVLYTQQGADSDPSGTRRETDMQSTEGRLEMPVMLALSSPARGDRRFRGALGTIRILHCCGRSGLLLLCISQHLLHQSHSRVITLALGPLNLAVRLGIPGRSPDLFARCWPENEAERLSESCSQQAKQAACRQSPKP